MTHSGADCPYRARSFRGNCWSSQQISGNAWACVHQVLWFLDTIGTQFVDMPVFVQRQIPRIHVVQSWRSAAARFRTTVCEFFVEVYSS